jgi:hypothetical protein
MEELGMQEHADGDYVLWSDAVEYNKQLINELTVYMVANLNLKERVSELEQQLKTLANGITTEHDIPIVEQYGQGYECECELCELARSVMEEKP